MGKMMEFRHLMGNPKYHEIWGKSYGSKPGKLTQGLPGRVEGTNAFFFTDTQDIPTVQWHDATHERVLVSYRP